MFEIKKVDSSVLTELCPFCETSGESRGFDIMVKIDKAEDTDFWPCNDETTIQCRGCFTYFVHNGGADNFFWQWNNRKKVNYKALAESFRELSKHGKKHEAEHKE